MPKPNECAYGPETQATVRPEFNCPECSGGAVTHKVSNYWRGQARERLGPDMLLCANHAAWYNVSHPDAAVPIKRKRIKPASPRADPPDSVSRDELDTASVYPGHDAVIE